MGRVGHTVALNFMTDLFLNPVPAREEVAEGLAP